MRSCFEKFPVPDNPGAEARSCAGTVLLPAPRVCLSCCHLEAGYVFKRNCSVLLAASSLLLLFIHSINTIDSANQRVAVNNTCQLHGQTTPMLGAEQRAYQVAVTTDA